MKRDNVTVLGVTSLWNGATPTVLRAMVLSSTVLTTYRCEVGKEGSTPYHIVPHHTTPHHTASHRIASRSFQHPTLSPLHSPLSIHHSSLIIHHPPSTTPYAHQ